MRKGRIFNISLLGVGLALTVIFGGLSYLNLMEANTQQELTKKQKDIADDSIKDMEDSEEIMDENEEYFQDYSLIRNGIIKPGDPAYPEIMEGYEHYLNASSDYDDAYDSYLKAQEKYEAASEAQKEALTKALITASLGSACISASVLYIIMRIFSLKWRERYHRTE